MSTNEQHLYVRSGISGTILVAGRKLSVCFYDHYFDEFIALSGVPHGSILAPLLFKICINDITSDLTVPCLLYADDLKLFSVIRSVEDCIKLQDIINKVTSWERVNGLQLNTKKCVAKTFSNKKSDIYKYAAKFWEI